MTLEEALNDPSIAPSLMRKALDVLHRIERLTDAGKTQVNDISASAVSNDRLKALAYAHEVNKAGRRMRRCREPESVPVHVMDAAPVPSLSPEQQVAEMRRCEEYAQECRARWRK